MELAINPAHRLYNLIKKLEPYFNFHRTSRTETPIQIWSGIFNIETEKEEDVINAFFACNKLIDKVENLLKSNQSTNKNIYLAPIPRLRGVFSYKHIYHFPDINGGNLFNHSDTTALQFCIDAIESFYSEKIVDEKELDKLIKSIRKLYSEIKKSNIDKRLKDLLLDLLKTMENSIHEYEIRGIESIEEAVAIVWGKLLINQNLIKNSEEKEVKEFSRLWSSFLRSGLLQRILSNF